jgi:N-acetylmuramoyl-L-alanine amidase
MKFWWFIFCLSPVWSLATICGPNDTARQCLLCNCYFESRGESYIGKVMVARTVLSRVASRQFPNTVCEVIYEKRQFSWTEDEEPNRMVASSRDCERAVTEATAAGPNGVLFFHTPPTIAWVSRSQDFKSCGRLGDHIFYVAVSSRCPPEFGNSNPPARSTIPSRGAN